MTKEKPTECNHPWQDAKLDCQSCNPKETPLSSKAIRKGDDLVCHTYNIKEAMENFEEDLNETYCKDCGNNPIKLFRKHFGSFE